MLSFAAMFALGKIGVSRPTFYRWYGLYRRFGEEGLEDRRACRRLTAGVNCDADFQGR